MSVPHHEYGTASKFSANPRSSMTNSHMDMMSSYGGHMNAGNASSRMTTAELFRGPTTASKFDFREMPTTAADFDFRRPTTAAEFDFRRPTTAAEFDFRRPTTAAELDFSREMPTTASEFEFRRPTATASEFDFRRGMPTTASNFDFRGMPTATASNFDFRGMPTNNTASRSFDPSAGRDMMMSTRSPFPNPVYGKTAAAFGNYWEH